MISINHDPSLLRLNRRPTESLHGDPQKALVEISRRIEVSNLRRGSWHADLHKREQLREEEIRKGEEEKTENVNRLFLFNRIYERLEENSLIIADGWDFAATASYMLQPRNPLTWLDPGPFGTLGVG